MEYIKNLTKNEYRKTMNRFKLQTVLSTLASMTNPFTHMEPELLNISSGAVVPAHIMKEELLEVLREYFEKRIQTNIDVFSPIRAMKLETFSVQKKNKVESCFRKFSIER